MTGVRLGSYYEAFGEARGLFTMGGILAFFIVKEGYAIINAYMHCYDMISMISTCVYINKYNNK